ERANGGTNDGAKRAGSGGTCGPARNTHQCIQVELRGGNVDFESRSVYRNMNFQALSKTEREAIIDVAGLPVAPGQKEQEVWLVAMPRNMPSSFKAAAGAERLVKAAGENPPHYSAT